MNRLRYLALKQFHYMNQVIQEHHELFAAIEQGNETLAAQRLGHHLGKLDDELPKLRGAYPEYFQD